MEIKHSAHLVSRISVHMSAHAHASMHTFMCGGEGGRSTQLLLGDGTFVLFPLFVWGCQKSLGGKVVEDILDYICAHCYVNPTVV